MPNYTYSARDMNGNMSNGVMQADNDAELRDKLRSSGLFLTRFKKSSDSAQKARSSFLPKKIKLMDLVIMSRQFATLVRSGVPIVETLAALKAQTENPTIAEALGALQLDVLEGANLSSAMEKHPRVFGPLYVSLVSAGEASGSLDMALEIIAEQLEKESVVQEQVKSAMAYPKLVVLACFGVVTFMLVFIVPTFSKVYAQFHATLPSVTLLLVSISGFVTKFWWLAILMVIGVIQGIKKFRATPYGKHLLDRVSLKAPLLGSVMRKIAIARFSQTLAGATKSGVPILNGLAISADTSGNSVISEAVHRVASLVSEGSPLAATLDQTGQFPPMVTRMIAAGEKAGNLEEMLSEIAKFYSRDVDYAVGRMTKMIEPLMTIVVGGIVLFILVALYMPVFNLSNVIKK